MFISSVCGIRESKSIKSMYLLFVARQRYAKPGLFHPRQDYEKNKELMEYQ